MLSKREIKQRYETFQKKYQIRTDKREARFYTAYLDKAFHNLEVAGILNILSTDQSKKEVLGIRSRENYHDWIIITSYYAMYIAASAALAKQGLKAVTHGATVIALEYRYCIEKSLLERKYICMIEQAKFGREDIGKIDKAMKGRVAVQYTITARYGEKESRRILADAKEFVNKISDIITD